MLELVFTSAKSGLIPGRSGFCSVAWTEGMPKNLISILENLSTYNILYPPNDPRSADNPVSYSYRKIRLGNRWMYVLSRIAFAGLDYTGRTNKIAHHIVIENDAELANLQYGPISACLCEDNFFTSWDGEPRLLPRRHRLNSASLSGYAAENWQNVMKNPEWAGHIADTFMNDPENIANCLYCEYDLCHKNSLLMLIAEIVRLMNKKYYNQFTFDTYFSATANDIGCFFRAALPNCQNLAAVKRFKPQELISLVDMTSLPANIPPTPAVLAARSNIKPEYPEDDLKLATSADIVFEAMPSEDDTQEEISLKQFLYDGTANYDEPVRIAKTKKALSPRARLIIFISCAFLFIAALIITSVILLKVLPEKENTAKNPPQDTSANDTILPANDDSKTKSPAEKTVEPPKSKVVPETKNVSEKQPPKKKETAAADKKITPPAPAVKQKPNSAPAKKTVLKLSPADNLQIFLGVTGSQTTFLLPKKLQNSKKLDLTVSGKWDDGVNITKPEKFIGRLNPRSLEVYSINQMSSSLIPDKSNPAVMTVKISDRYLEIKEPSAMYAPRKKYIKTITFHTPAGKYTWHNKWNSKYVQVIPHGIIDENFIYRKSKEEIQLADHIIISNDKFPKLKTTIENWNKYINNYNKAHPQEKDAPVYVKSDVGAVCSLCEKLKKALDRSPSRINFNEVKKEYDKLYLNMTGLQKSDIDGKFSEYLKKLRTDVRKKIDSKRSEMKIDKKENITNSIDSVQRAINKINLQKKPDSSKLEQLKKKLADLKHIAALERYHDSLELRIASNTKTVDTLKEIADMNNNKLKALMTAKTKNKTLTHKDTENNKKWHIPTENIHSKFIADYQKQQSINKKLQSSTTKDSAGQNKLKRERNQLVSTFELYGLSNKWNNFPYGNKPVSPENIQELRKELISKVKRSAKGTK